MQPWIVIQTGMVTGWEDRNEYQRKTWKTYALF